MELWMILDEYKDDAMLDNLLNGIVSDDDNDFEAISSITRGLCFCFVVGFSWCFLCLFKKGEIAPG